MMGKSAPPSPASPPEASALFFLYSIIQSSMEKHTWRHAVCHSSNSPPSARWGHACCLADGQLVIFGGYADSQYRNDLWAYDTARMAWQECKTTGDVPSPRSNSTMHFDAARSRLVLFGGGGPNKLRYNDVSVLDWESREWKTLLPPQGDPAPWERTYHSSELLYPYLFVFGGEGIADLGDLWAFNLQTQLWTELPVEQSGRPCARRFHASAVVGSTLFVIAGCHDKYRCLSDVYAIDLQPFLAAPAGCSLEWRELHVKGASFLSRWGHSASVLEGRVYIFGGRFSSDLQDILVLDPLRETLKTMKVQGDLPKPRRRHSGTFVGSSLLVFGGFNGQYFNDLNYINVFELPPRREVRPLEQSKTGKRQWINRRLLADFTVTTRENATFYGHKGLFIDRFANKDQFSQFTAAIQGQYSLQQLYDLFEVLYSGIGSIPQAFDLSHLALTIFETEHEREAHFRRCLTGEAFQSSLLQPKGKQSQTISIPGPLYSDFLESRSSLHTDFFLTLSEEYCLPANRALLASSSQYFEFLLKQSSELRELRVELPAEQFGDVRVLQVLVNYLERGQLVVPEGLDEDCWASLLHLATYFCIAVQGPCEAELLQRIRKDNCERLLELALQEGLEDLQAHCLEFLFRGLLEQGGQALREIRDKEHRTGRENALFEFYRLWEFDLDQAELKRKEAEEASRKPQPPPAHCKENTEALPY